MPLDRPRFEFALADAIERGSEFFVGIRIDEKLTGQHRTPASGTVFATDSLKEVARPVDEGLRPYPTSLYAFSALL